MEATWTLCSDPNETPLIPSFPTVMIGYHSVCGPTHTSVRAVGISQGSTLLRQHVITFVLRYN